jgi:hypothetical protein
MILLPKQKMQTIGKTMCNNAYQTSILIAYSLLHCSTELEFLELYIKPTIGEITIRLIHNFELLLLRMETIDPPFRTSAINLLVHLVLEVSVLSCFNCLDVHFTFRFHMTLWRENDQDFICFLQAL